MTITQETKQNATIFRLVGRFDFKARVDFTTATKSALQGTVPHIILNFEGVPYMDSAGMGLLGNFDNELKSKRFKATLSNLQPIIQKVIHLARLDTKFNISSTEEEALLGKTLTTAAT
jgi:anti-anti-sigma factor